MQKTLRRVGKVLGVLFVSVLGLVVLAYLIGAVAKANLKRNYPIPGKMVDVGGYSLHIDCVGQGAPAVLLISGTGGTAVVWSKTIEAISETNKVCYYDRAGIGWSDTQPRAKTFEAMAEELNVLITQAGLNDDLVLVGHSVGGIIGRHYAQKYPEKVVGMVLVDSANEKQFLRFPPEIRASARKSMASITLLKLLSATNILALVPSMIPSETNASEEENNTHKALLITNPYFVSQMELEIGLQLNAQTRPVDTLGDIPLIVLSHSVPSPGLPGDVSEPYESAWQEIQLEHSMLSTNGKLVKVENSGHNIQLDRPDVVIEAIQEIAGQIGH
jgi:pimeloyl-ACP methyl ester carboxylesterase